MIIYNPDSLYKLRVCKETKKWLSEGIINKIQFENIVNKYNHGLYIPSFYIRIALFVFTFIASLAVIGITALIIAPMSPDEAGVGLVAILLSIGSYFILEAKIKSNHLFRSGIDDALLYVSMLLFLIGLGLLLVEVGNLPIVFLCIMAIPIFLWSLIRFTDSVAALLLFGNILFILFYFFNEIGLIGQSLLPFVGMTYAIFVFYLVIKFNEKEQSVNYELALLIIEISSLLTFYFSGNYFIVREFREQLLDVSLGQSEDIPLAYFFYLFTFITPLVYIFLGLKKRNYVLLRVGLFIAAVSVITFKYYYSLGYHEISLMVSGVVLILLVIVSIKILKRNKSGITEKEIWESEFSKLNVEGLLWSEIAPNGKPEDPGIKFGEGEFGGGGSSSKWE